ncbi:hypothetical protein [Arthrobacter sp. N1]|uniref:hypothetical protein n=1 Tax=Arthrobacter sp. N1 TaxID=619291 RepID=UPI003BAED5C3
MATASIRGLGRIPLDDILGAKEPSEGFGEEWHGELEHFIHVCWQRVFVGVVLEESLYGQDLNVRASTLDTATGKAVKLQAYWQDGEGDEPVLWLSAGGRTQAAHADPEMTEMLSGFHAGTRDHLRSALTLLHRLGDLAEEIAAGKAVQTASMLTPQSADPDLAELAETRIHAEALEDALAAMNGIARIYTGSVERGVRDS